MANVLNKNPLVIDTPSASVLITDDLFIAAIRWDAESLSVAGDQAIVQDQNGNNIWESNATGANFDDQTTFADESMTGRRVSGLKVPTLNHGKLYIYLR